MTTPPILWEPSERDIENAQAKIHNSEGVPLEQFTLDDLAWIAELLGVEYNIV